MPQGEYEMTIDAEIRHITKAGSNMFLELGFPVEEAKRLRAESNHRINDAQLLKEPLMAKLAAKKTDTT